MFTLCETFKTIRFGGGYIPVIYSLKVGKNEVLNVKIRRLRSTILHTKTFYNYRLSPKSHLSHAGQKRLILFLVTYFSKVV